ncbi:MAG: DUF554 domain-containing protein [Oscillospiraceae bacterium]|nr:DUF554 domain-containing protein [Oscillospiraceae bacterium]
MPIGVIVNVALVVLGGLLGSVIGGKLSDSFKANMTMVFGFCAMTMVISSIVLMKNLSAVIFAVIFGTIIGLVLNLDGLVRKGMGAALGKLKLGAGENADLMLTAFVLFCISGTGVYGTLVSGMTGDHSILIAKSILDFFTAMIFACSLKRAVCLVAVPQIIILLLLFFSAKLIYPLTTEAMIGDFKSTGGVVLLATGFSILKLKDIRVINMIPAMIIAMPISALWTNAILPLLS